jgi:hypothetical protein
VAPPLTASRCRTLKENGAGPSYAVEAAMLQKEENKTLGITAGECLAMKHSIANSSHFSTRIR